MLEEVLSQNPYKSLAERTTEITVTAAKRYAPHLFGDLPPILSNIFFGSRIKNHPPSATYGYGPECAGYNFDCETYVADAFSTFVCGCMHETIHILQTHLAVKAKERIQTPYYCENLATGRISGASPYDTPAITSPPGTFAPIGRHTLDAYRARPTEWEANSFERALKIGISSRWVPSVSPTERVPRPEKYIQAAKNNHIITTELALKPFSAITPPSSPSRSVSPNCATHRQLPHQHR